MKYITATAFAKRMAYVTPFLVFFFSTASHAANVELGPIGDDEPNYVWCVKDRHKVKQGGTFLAVFRGRSTNDQTIPGRIHIAAASSPFFQWVEFLESDPDHSPQVLYTPTLSVLNNPEQRRVQAKPTTPEGLYFVRFVGVDNTGDSSEPIQGCLVDVVKHLPDIELVNIAYEPSEPGAPTRTVVLTIKNNMPASAQPLAGVPWSLSASERTGPELNAPSRTRQLALGMQGNIPPGITVQVIAQIPKIPFPRASSMLELNKLIGEVDPYNYLQENETNRPNNRKMITLEYDSDTPPVSGIPIVDAPPLPASIPAVCQPGEETVALENGRTGCINPIRRCNNWLEALFVPISRCEDDTFICAINADCDRAGQVCPQSGSRTHVCTRGRIAR